MGAWTRTPPRFSGALARFFPDNIDLTSVSTGSARWNLHHQSNFYDGHLFRGCSHSLMFRPVGLLTTPIAPTAAAHTVGQPWFLRPSLSQVVASPRLGYANRPNRAIDGIGTFTLSDMQPCRLLPLRRA